MTRRGLTGREIISAHWPTSQSGGIVPSTPVLTDNDGGSSGRTGVDGV